MKQFDMATRIALKQLGWSDDEIDALVEKQKAMPLDDDDWPVKTKSDREEELTVAVTGLSRILATLETRLSVQEQRLVERALDAVKATLDSSGTSAKATQRAIEKRLTAELAPGFDAAYQNVVERGRLERQRAKAAHRGKGPRLHSPMWYLDPSEMMNNG